MRAPKLLWLGARLASNRTTLFSALLGVGISHCPRLTKVGPAEGDDVGVVVVQTELLLVELPAAVSAPGGRVLLETLLSELVVLLTQLFILQHLVRAVDQQELVMGTGVILKKKVMYDMYNIPLTYQIDCIIQQIYGKLITHCSWTHYV